MLLSGDMDDPEPVLQRLLLEVEQAGIGDALQAGTAKDLEEGFVVQCEEQVRVAQSKHAGLVQGMHSSSSLPFNGVIARLCSRVESGPTVHCLPACPAAARGGSARSLTVLLHQPEPHAQLGPVRGKGCGESHVV